MELILPIIESMSSLSLAVFALTSKRSLFLAQSISAKRNNEQEFKCGFDEAWNELEKNIENPQLITREKAQEKTTKKISALIKLYKSL